MSLVQSLWSDYKNNKSFKGKIIVMNYTFMRFFRVRMTNRVNFILFSPFILFYKLTTDFLLGCEIPASVKIGRGLVIHHGRGLVLNSNVVIGKNVTLKHNTTIGNKQSIEGSDLGSPSIGDNVVIAPHSIIVGPIHIGKNSIIGAGSVVVKDVPAFSVVAGNPAKIIKYLQ